VTNSAVTPARAGQLTAAQRRLLESRIRASSVAGAASSSVMSPQPRPQQDEPAPLSIAQERPWYFNRLAPGVSVFNEAVTIRKDGAFDVDAFRRAFTELVHRHEAWRTTFTELDTGPVQIVHPPSTVDVPLVDLRSLSPDAALQEAARQAAEVAREPYDLAAGPLLRPMLVRFTDSHHRLYLAMHHLVFDGVSLYRTVLPELVALYDAFSAGNPSPLSEPAVRYTDYARAEHAWVANARLRDNLERWRSLASAPPLELPTDHPRPARQQFHGGMLAVEVPKVTVEGLRGIGQQNGATLFQVLGAAFGVLLSRYSGQDDVVFGTESDARRGTEWSSLVGYCLTPLLIRCQLADDPSFHELLQRVRADVVSALDAPVPFDWLVQELAGPRVGVNRLFQAMLILEPPLAAVDPEWSLHQMEAGIGDAIGHAKLDLSLELDERPDGHLAGRVIYDSDLFDRQTAERMIGHWLTLLNGVLAGPDRPVSTLPVLPDREQQEFADWNATQVDYPRDSCLHGLIEARCRQRPDEVAVQFNGSGLTYAELDRWSDRVAARLQAADVGPGQVVAFHAHRSLEMVVGLVGILKSGAAYLPLDPGHPPDRLSYMLDDSGATVLLTAGDAPLLAGAPVKRIEMPGRNVTAREQKRDVAVCADDPAYVLYTSGSTGRPKGVRVQHRAVVNLVSSMACEPGMDAGDVVVAVTTHAFDISVVELLLPLTVGARVVVASREQAADGRLLARLLDDAGATILQATPATWEALLEAGWTGRPDLVALCGGESLPPAVAAALLERCSELWNCYGPTETTVWSTLARITRADDVTIGRPMANTRVYVLGRHGEQTPIGVSGELCIGGDGVAEGYLGRPELTRERFVPEPGHPWRLMYRTGDVVTFLPDGRLRHLGRLDHQIKLRGFRIEPGEIEAALLEEPGVSSALVVASGSGVGARLVSYVVAPAGRIDAGDVRGRLRTCLPDYMVPTAIVALDAWPLNGSGKIDRGALPAPAFEARSDAGARAVPRTPLEKQLCQAFAKTLRLAGVGIDDDFFELGGHSLLAVRLTTEVKRRTGRDLPLAALFEVGATPARLAAYLEPAASASPAGGPVPLGEDRTPLFFIHPNQPSLLTLRHFMRALPTDERIVGLLPEQPHTGAPGGGIAEQAQALLTSIRRTQPRGPYVLAGYSRGGLLAYEIARLLTESGERVAFMGLVDTVPPSLAALLFGETARQRFLRHWSAGLRQFLRACGEAIGDRSRAVRARMPGIRQQPDYFDRARVRAWLKDYDIATTTAPLTLFVSEDAAATLWLQEWQAFHPGPLQWHQVPGGHTAMVLQPNVAVLAATVAESVRAALRHESAGLVG